MWAPLLAGGAALTMIMIGLHGTDLAAAVYRVDLFNSSGLTLWDSQWYGGHWTLDYSVIYPPVAGTIGIPATEVASAATAALMFDRLAVAHYGRTARAGSLLFAIGTVAPVIIGQVPFLLGEALALTAVWAAHRGRWTAAGAGAAAASLASPLAGAFLVLAIVAWLLASWPRLRVRLIGLMVAGLTPIVLPELLFAGQGAMPFTATDFVWLLVVVAAVGLLVPVRERALRIGLALYLAAIVLSFVFATPVGINVSRLGESLGAPLAACVLWRRSRWLLVAAVLSLAVLQWGPAVTTFAAGRADPSTQAAYFRPLVSFLRARERPLGRVELVPTALHWEAAYVAPYIPLARGWERQLDVADNPIFYGNAQRLDPSSYRAWLLDNGVRYVALPAVALDYAAVAEGRLVRAGVPGLRLAWRNANWRVYLVIGAPGIVSGPARGAAIDASHVALVATARGTILLRERYAPNWTVLAGDACLSESAGGWIDIQALRPGAIRLGLSLLPGAPAGVTCRAPQRA